MSGVAGGNRIKKQNVQDTFNDFIEKILNKIPGYKVSSLSGSVKSGSKPDFGDLDIIATFEYDDKKVAKQAIIDTVSKMPDSLIIPFKSERYAGKRFYNSGEIISVLYPIKGAPGESIQVDIMVSLSEVEHQFKNSFLDLPAEVQGLILGLVKTTMLEQDPAEVFSRLGISNIPALGPDQEYEFNLSSVNLTLRIVTLDNFRETARQEVWKSNSWQDIKNLLSNFDLSQPFEKLLDQVTSSLKNPRSKNRVAGIFRSMISVKSGEVGTIKGDNKEKALAQVAQTLTEEAGSVIGLYGGGFKPPHKGHFYLASELSKEVTSMKIYIGRGVRDGELITPEQAKDIWNIYARYLQIPQESVEIEIAPMSPVRSIYEEIENNKEQDYVVVSSTDPEDLKKYNALQANTKGLYNKARLKIVGTIKEEEEMNKKFSATQVRTDSDFLKSGDWMPEVIGDDDKKAILSILKATPEYKMSEAIENVFSNLLGESVSFTRLETTLDTMFDDLDIDINFTRHFKERVIERGLTEEDILDLMSKIHDKYGDALAKLPKDSNRVFTHLTKLVDITSAMGGYDYDGLKDLYLTTAFKRKDRSEPEFRTNDNSPKLKVAEESLSDLKYTKPNFSNEWEEALRYPELEKIGKDGWIQLAQKGSTMMYSHIKGVLGNVDLDFQGLESAKKERFEQAFMKGVIEMPIAIKFGEGDYDLVAGNTRLSGLVKNGIDPEIWVVDIKSDNSKLVKEGETSEVTMGTPVTPISVVPSVVRQRMQDLTVYFRDLAPDDVIVDFNGQSIVITPMIYNKAEPTGPADFTPNQKAINEVGTYFNYVPYIAGILEYMIKKGMKVVPLPEIKTRQDEENATQTFGKTASYDPVKKEVVLYVTGRHPKDVLRSFCHEMIHHIQNQEGRLPTITTSNTHEDAALSEIEKEAHYLGSMTMREYEDLTKNEYNNPQDGKSGKEGSGLNPVEEGTKYRSIVVDVRQAVNDALNVLISGKKVKGYNVKTLREPKKKDVETAGEYGMSPLGVMLSTEYQVAYLGKFTSLSEKGTRTEDGRPITVEVNLKFAQSNEVEPGKYYIDGEASSDDGELDIILAFNPQDSTSIIQQIQSTLTDLIRHEIEHLTQSGAQLQPTKWMRGDLAMRKRIRQNPETFYKYFMLPKEVDANIQGLNMKANYDKVDFQSTVDQYLDSLVDTDVISVEKRKEVYDKFKARIPQIGGIPNLS